MSVCIKNRVNKGEVLVLKNMLILMMLENNLNLYAESIVVVKIYCASHPHSSH
jgi:hypothetical protein